MAMWTRSLLLLLPWLAACSAKPSPLQFGSIDPAAGTGAGSASVSAAAGAGAAGPGAGSAPAPAPTPAPASAPAPAGPGPGASPVPALPSGVQAVKVTLADVGLEASSLDRTADPCVDFYQFACGGWLQNNPIPPDRARWGRFSELEEKNLAALRGLLEEAAKGIGADAATKRLGDYYASCMDEAVIERGGTAGIRTLLDRMTNVKDARTWLAAVAELHKLGRWVVWRTKVDADQKESTTNIVYLDAAGLGLPDRDYYAKPELRKHVDAYRAHVARTLALALPGIPAARTEAAAGDVLAIEAELAKLMKSRTEKRNLPAMYNPTDGPALARQVTSIDWKAYWKALGVEPTKKLVLGTPAFFAQLDKLRASFTWPQWSSYFTYHLVHDLSFALPKAFDAEAFELEKQVSGTEKQRERDKRCIGATRAAMGEQLGAKYIEKYFTPAARQTASRLIDTLVEVMHGEIGQLDWMSEPTRQLAQGKLARVVRMTGYPDHWRTYDYEVKRDDFLGNSLRAAAFATRRELTRAGKPVDRSEWQMQAYDVNAYYEPTANTAALPAGILQPPFFGPDRAIAANLGGIGMVIGHELTHGFDDQGAQFDGAGNLTSWWDKQDAKRFEDRTACVADLYSTFEAMPGGFVNGRLTLGENIADLGGVKVAFAAYRSMRRDAAKVYVADGFTEDQQFFLGVGQGWCGRDRPAEIQRRLLGDPHAPPKFRVYGSLRDLPAFAESFSCAPGTPMRPARTCTVW